MGELSFLTIIVSLAVCSLLVYAVFQYMKVRLTILEQSHKEQAMILQQYIEESSTDIHRLYKMTISGNGGMVPPNGSIILEYANENVTEKPVAYNEPHMIHLDTALFHNNRSSNLIEISSDSEDTTDTENTTDTDTDDHSDESENEHSDDENDSDGDSDCESHGHDIKDTEQSEHDLNTKNEVLVEPVISDILDFVCKEQVTHSHSSEIKLVTIDLGTIQEPSSEPADLTSQISSSERQNDVLSMLYKKAQQTPLPDDNDTIEPALDSAAPAVVVSSTSLPLSGMSVTELKLLLKEKFKNHPEKHAEIQKLKKAELIHALQQTQ